jgi:uncharacterized membrane protein
MADRRATARRPRHRYRDIDMEQTALLAITIAAGVGVIATLAILRNERRSTDARAESPFAASTEGEKRCPKCGMGNLWTDDRCISCGARFPG